MRQEYSAFLKQRNAARAFEGFVSSSGISGRWGDHYFGQRHENPVPDVVEKLHGIRDDLASDPALVKFMLETTALLKSGVGQAKASDPEVQKLRALLDGLSVFLQGLVAEKDLLARSDLPEEYQKLISILEKDTAQKPLRPIAGTGLFLKSYVSHIYEHVREKPGSAVGAFGASLGFLWLVNHKMGGATTSYIDPLNVAITNMGMGEFGADFEFDPTVSLEGLQPSCHNHVSDVFGPEVADFAQPVLPEHCSKFKTLAEDAQSSAQGFYDAVNSRIEGLIHMPLSDLFGKVVDHEAFMRGFETGARETAEFIYQFNAVENITLHYVIGTIAFDQGRKLGRVTSDEAREALQKITNFTWRTARQVPLAYAAGLGLSINSYVAHGGLNPEMVWTGAAGVVGGLAVHKLAGKVFNRKARAKAVAGNAGESLAGFERFSVPEDVQARLDAAASKGRGWMKKGAVSLAAAAGAAGFAKEFPEMAGVIAGGLTVSGSFLAYNVPEDAALHVIFGIAGGTAGYGYGLVERKIFRRGQPAVGAAAAPENV